MEFADLSVEELQRKLEETKNHEAALARLLEKRKQEGRGDVANEVKDLIASRGYALDDILPLLQKGRRGGAKDKNDGPRRYYVDPNNPNHTYVRGVLPGWMKEKMAEQGYDPSNRDDRQTFKTTYLQLRED